MNKDLTKKLLLYNPDGILKKKQHGQFWGNTIKAKKLSFGPASDFHYFINPTKKNLHAFYRLDLIRLYLGKKQYSRSALIGEAIALFVSYFENYLIKQKCAIPPVDMLIDIVGERATVKDVADYNRWVEAEADLIEHLKLEPFYRPLKFKEIENYGDYRKFWDNSFKLVLELAKEVNKGKKISKQHLPIITLIKRLMIYLENHIDDKE